jgi:large subunit ribosomal protein L14
MLTKVEIIDNSGGIEARIIKILNKKSDLDVGTLVLVSILSNIPNSKVKKGEVYKGMIVRDNTSNFSYSLYCKKGIILVKTKNNEVLPIGSRIKGFISSKLKNIEGTERILAITKATI